jgi:hypothetical protein
MGTRPHGIGRADRALNVPSRSLVFYYGPTMNAFAAAEQNGKSAELQRELEDLFERQNRSTVAGATSIPAAFLRVTATV